MKASINLINQVFEIEQKITQRGDASDIGRNIDRIKNHLEELGFSYHSPAMEKYSDTRTDCVASIVGELREGEMIITKVIKPMVFQLEHGNRTIIQKAVVIVEARA